VTSASATADKKARAFIRAIAALRKHDWQAAHTIAQDYEDDPIGDHLHAIVHRIEGDLANARYWYNKAREKFDATASVEAELVRIEAKLAAPRLAKPPVRGKS
jgi:TPR repeat protein